LLQVPKTDATFLAAVPGTEVATCLYTKTDATSLAAVPGRGCYMFSKTDATSLADVPGTEVASCSQKLMLHP
jgi:hypothetical protein